MKLTRLEAYVRTDDAGRGGFSSQLFADVLLASSDLFVLSPESDFQRLVEV